jgi:hypothetical protein
VKRRVVAAGVVLFALWPAVHRGLVAVFDANPWKLAGWAMYATPHFPSEVSLRLVRGGEERPVEDLSEWERALVDEFVERRYTLGRLASPETVARELLARSPEADAVVVEIATPYLEVSSAMIRERRERRVYRR